MTAWFNDSTLRRLYVEGSVQTIMFPMENDSTYNKYSYTESSYMDAYFENGEVDRIIMWPETTGKVTPLYLAKRAAYFLPTFRWLGPLRPMSPDEVFDYPPEMDDLKSMQIFSKVRPDAFTIRGSATGREVPKPAVPDTPPSAQPLSPAAVADSLSHSLPVDSMRPDASLLDSLSRTLPQIDSLGNVPTDSVASPAVAAPQQNPDAKEQQGAPAEPASPQEPLSDPAPISPAIEPKTEENTEK